MWMSELMKHDVARVSAVSRSQCNALPITRTDFAYSNFHHIDVTAQRRTRWQKEVEADCQDPRAREVAKAVEAGSRRQETVDGGRELVKLDDEGGPG